MTLNPQQKKKKIKPTKQSNFQNGSYELERIQIEFKRKINVRTFQLVYKHTEKKTIHQNINSYTK